MADGYSLSAPQNIEAKLRKSSFHRISSAGVVHADQRPADREDNLLHVVMVPYPVQGQINPMMQFAKLLMAKHPHIMVTFVNNKRNHDCICRTRSTAMSSSTRHTAITKLDGSAPADPPINSRLHLTWLDDGLPPDFSYSDASGPDRFREFQEATVRMKEPLRQLLQSLNHKSPPVSCVLFGAFCPWAQSAAAELSIPTFLFWTQSAFMFSIYYHMPLLVANGFFPFNEKRVPGSNVDDIYGETSACVTYIPGLPPLHPSSFPSLLHVDDFSDDSLATVKEQFSLVGNCKGVIINSFEELEKETLQALQLQSLPYPISLVGPLLPSAFSDGTNANDKSIGASLLQEKSDCINWLDGKKKHSVLYVSFGSLFNPSAAELESIAIGIQSSKQPYLWVIRSSSSVRDVADILPKSFVEETKGYGLIIPWAPQVQVLSHPSVGAFLTHCGWNSTLESLSMGMPMISFPMHLDQPTNSAYVCEIWRVGIALKRQGDGKVKSEDVEKVVRTILQGEEGLQMRERSSKLREAARQAVQAQGSSNAHIHKFIQSLTKLVDPAGPNT